MISPPKRSRGKLRQMEVDVLVDLNGHTRGDNFDILSHRPAPVQATWLGYAGTTAAPFMDYVIADPVVAPDAAAFSEKIVNLPVCFFANDTSRKIGVAPGRAEAGLPQDGFVFAASTTISRSPRRSLPCGCGC